MNRFLTLLLLLVSVVAGYAAGPTLENFDQTHFRTNAPAPGIIRTRLSSSNFDQSGDTWTITNITGATGASKWTNHLDGFMRVIPGNAENGIETTNHYIQRLVNVKGAVVFDGVLSSNLVAGQNDLNTYEINSIRLSGVATPMDATISLSGGHGSGQLLIVENYLDGTGFCILAGQTLWDDPTKSIILPNGDWCPLAAGEQIWLRMNGLGNWVEVLRVITSGPGFAIINPTDNYIPFRLGPGVFWDSPFHIPPSGGTLVEAINDSTNVFTISKTSGYTGTGTLFLTDNGTYQAVGAAEFFINPTDNYIPVRSSATTFDDSAWFRPAVGAVANAGLTRLGMTNTLPHFSTSPVLGIFQHGDSKAALVVDSVQTGTRNPIYVYSITTNGSSVATHLLETSSAGSLGASTIGQQITHGASSTNSGGNSGVLNVAGSIGLYSTVTATEATASTMGVLGTSDGQGLWNVGVGGRITQLGTGRTNAVFHGLLRNQGGSGNSTVALFEAYDSSDISSASNSIVSDNAILTLESRTTGYPLIIGRSDNGTTKFKVESNSGWTGAGTLFLSDDGTYKTAGGGGGGTTINPTDNYLPYRSNGTTFGDSPIERLAANSVGFDNNGTNQMVWTGGVFPGFTMYDGGGGIARIALPASALSIVSTGQDWRFSGISLVPQFAGAVIGSTANPINGFYIHNVVWGDGGSAIGWTNAVADGAGNGNPEGVRPGGPGSIYRNTNGAPGSIVWVKETGDGNTGWAALGSGGGGGSTLWANASGVIKPLGGQVTNALLFTSGSVDAATNSILTLDTVNAWTNIEAKFLQGRNQGTNTMFITKSGALEIGRSVEEWWVPDDTESIVSVHDLSKGESDYNVFHVAAIDDISSVTNYASHTLTLSTDVPGGNSPGLIGMWKASENTVDSFFRVFVQPGNTVANIELVNQGTRSFYVEDISGYTGAGTLFLSDDGTYKAAGGGGTAGTVINTGASTVGAVPRYTDLTGTNIAPTSVTISGDTLTSQTLYSATNFPFIPSKLYTVFMGDSISASQARPSYPYVLYTNYHGWKDALFFQNISVAGDTLSGQTNKFWGASNIFSQLPQNPTGGTNVLISIWTGANDLTSDYAAYINSISNLVSIFHGYGWKVAWWTMTPRGTWLPTMASDNSGGMSKSRYMVNTWLLNNTNIDYVIDGASVIPDCTDITYYDDANDALPLGQTHPSAFSHSVLAREFDKTLRLPNGWERHSPNHYREGPFWIWRNQKDGLLANLIGTNGAIMSVRGGNFTNIVDPQVGGFFAAGNASNPALVASAATNHTTGNVFVVQNAANAPIMRVTADNRLIGGLAMSSLASAAFSTAGTGNNFLQLANIAAAGRTFYVGSISDGSFQIQNNTLSSDVFVIGERVTALTNSASTICVAVTLPSGAVVGGRCCYKLYASDGTDHQLGAGQFTYSAVSKAGAITVDLEDTDDSQSVAASSGTLTWTWAIATSGTSVNISVTPVSSLTPTTLNFRGEVTAQGTGASTITTQP